MNNLARINIGLGVAALLFVVYAVVQTNALAAHAWSTRDAQNSLAAMLDERNTLVAQQAAVSNREQLILLAQQAGMVPVPMSSIVYLTQDRSVAAR